MRRRMIDAAISKARRGELRIGVPVGFVWERDGEFEIDPDRRVQQAIGTVFRLFDRLGSARQVLLRMREDGLLFPRPEDGKQLTKKTLGWRLPVYRNIISVLQNPVLRGCVRLRPLRAAHDPRRWSPAETYGHERGMDDWTVLLRDHHRGYITWEQFEKNQARLQQNAFRKPAGDAKSGRGGRALLTGLLRCRRCGRMLQVTYSGDYGLARYSCKLGNAMHGLAPCINFGARRGPDAVVARVLLDVVQPLAVEAAIMADEQASLRERERRQALELERQQAEYEVRRATNPSMPTIGSSPPSSRRGGTVPSHTCAIARHVSQPRKRSRLRHQIARRSSRSRPISRRHGTRRRPLCGPSSSSCERSSRRSSSTWTRSRARSSS